MSPFSEKSPQNRNRNILEPLPIDERVTRVHELLQHNKKLVETLHEKGVSEETLQSELKTILLEIDLLEERAERDYAVLNISSETAESIGVIWTFAGPGTYDLETKEDRYQEFPWARWMDRDRLNYTAKLARKIVEKKLSKSFSVDAGTTESPEEITARILEKKKEVHEALADVGPYIVYNGSPIENETVKEVLARPTTHVPTSKVFIIDKDSEGKPLANTVSQMKAFHLPSDALEGKKIALVSHAPHLSRIVRMINLHRPFPVGTEIILFPIPTVPEGKAPYAAMESEGILWYTYVSSDSTIEPYPFQLNSVPLS